MIFLSLDSLCYMPCGCAVDLEGIESVFGILTCPWCGAEFEHADFIEYQADCQVPFMRQPPILATDGKDVLEIVGKSGCGHAVVRKREDGAKLEHCTRPLAPLKD